MATASGVCQNSDMFVELADTFPTTFEKLQCSRTRFSLSKFWWHSCVNDDALKRCASPDTEQSLKHFPYGSMNGHALVTVWSDVLVVLQELWHGASCTWQIWRNMMGKKLFCGSSQKPRDTGKAASVRRLVTAHRSESLPPRSAQTLQHFFAAGRTPFAWSDGLSRFDSEWTLC